MFEALTLFGVLLVPPVDQCAVTSRFACVYGRSSADVSLVCDRNSCELVQEIDSTRLIILAQDNSIQIRSVAPGETCFELMAVSRDLVERGSGFRLEVRNQCSAYDVELILQYDPEAKDGSGFRNAIQLLASTSLCIPSAHGTHCPSETLYFLLPRIGWELAELRRLTHSGQ